MVPLFVGYALYFWWLIANRRRSLRGLWMVVLSIAGLGAIHLLHTWLAYATEGLVQLPVLRALLVPYAALVAGVGLFVLAIPIHAPGPRCRCGYSLSGLEAVAGRVACPECGRVQPDPSTRVYRPSGMDRPDLRRTDIAFTEPTEEPRAEVPPPRVISREVIRGPGDRAAPSRG